MTFVSRTGISNSTPSGPSWALQTSAVWDDLAVTNQENLDRMRCGRMDAGHGLGPATHEYVSSGRCQRSGVEPAVVDATQLPRRQLAAERESEMSQTRTESSDELTRISPAESTEALWIVPV